MFKTYKFSGALLACLLTGTANADLAIISHVDYQGGELDRFNVKKLFLGKRQAFPDGHKAYPVQHAAGSPDRREFFESVLGMNESSYKSHWNRMVATGRSTWPDELNNYREVLEWVASTPGSISYIDPKMVNDSVKVLITIRDIQY